MEEDFEKYLDLSDQLRNGYRESLGPIQKDWSQILQESLSVVPELLRVVYSRCSGTYYEIENQKLMDFVPGYLLIHINEYAKNNRDLNNILIGRGLRKELAPILRSYSSDFYAVDIRTGDIFLVFHDDEEIHLIHRNTNDFLVTLENNYLKNVYFLDEDGFLDYDADLEYEVAQIHNKGIEFWEEEDD